MSQRHKLTDDDRQKGGREGQKALERRPGGHPLRGRNNWQKKDPAARRLRGEVLSSRVRAERAVIALKNLLAHT